MILTPYEPTRVLNEYGGNDQHNDGMHTASHEEGEVNSVLWQNDKSICPACSKTFSKRSNLYRHTRNFHAKFDDDDDDESPENEHDDKKSVMSIDNDGDESREQRKLENEDDDDDVNNLSATSSEHTNVSKKMSGSNIRDSSMSTSSSDDDDDDDNASKENFSSNELSAWMGVLKHSPVLDELCENDKIQNIDDLYRREIIRKCLFAAANTVMRYKKTMKALRQGRLYPAIRYEMKRLAKHRYGKRERIRKAWLNRKYLFKEMLQANRAELKSIIRDDDDDDEDDTDENN